MSNIVEAVKRRPYRLVEALLALAAAFGVALSPDQTAAILAVFALLFTASEMAQTQTTPLAEPCDAEGRPLVTHGEDDQSTE